MIPTSAALLKSSTIGPLELLEVVSFLEGVIFPPIRAVFLELKEVYLSNNPIKTLKDRACYLLRSSWEERATYRDQIIQTLFLSCIALITFGGLLVALNALPARLPFVPFAHSFSSPYHLDAPLLQRITHASSSLFLDILLAPITMISMTRRHWKVVLPCFAIYRLAMYLRPPPPPAPPPAPASSAPPPASAPAPAQPPASASAPPPAQPPAQLQ